MNSCIYKGSVVHRRIVPKEHKFRYGLFMLYLDLDELEEVFGGRWIWSYRRPSLAWFRRKDHMGEPTRPLAECVRDTVAAQLGERPEGPIRILTQLRYFGIGFSPVSFYYCYERDGTTLHSIVAEVNNTPWLEQHNYVLAARDGNSVSAVFEKAFHVSPFMGMDMKHYIQTERPGNVCNLIMNNRQGEEIIFEALLSMKREEISTLTLNKALLLQPIMTLKILLAIYWQAAVMWIKGFKVYTHPSKLEEQRS